MAYKYVFNKNIFFKININSNHYNFFIKSLSVLIFFLLSTLIYKISKLKILIYKLVEIFYILINFNNY